MDKKIQEFINDIRKKLDDLYASDLFASEDKKLANLSDACKAFLIYVGYRVTESNLPELNIKTQEDLISLFYNCRSFYHPESYAIGRAPVKIDRTIAKLFVESRMQDGSISKATALNQCANIIKTVFKYEDEFNFNFPVTFSFFGQKKFAWVTDMAIQIMERNRINKEEKHRDELIAEYEKDYMKTVKDVPFGDLDEILDRVRNNHK
jgi:hypothetical protein